MGRDDIAELIQPGHFGLDAFATREDGSCVHLGDRNAPHACRIYEVRGTTCRDFEVGSPQCLEFRRDLGVDGPKGHEGESTVRCVSARTADDIRPE